MTGKPPKCNDFFRPGDQVGLGVHLSGCCFAEDAAMVIRVDGREMTVELCGSGFLTPYAPSPGDSAVIVGRGVRSVYWFRAHLRKAVTGRLMKLQLADLPEIQERREYARMDVTVPMGYKLPAGHDMRQVLNDWLEMKKSAVTCRNGGSIASDHEGEPAGLSPCRVNLSGSGLRFKINDCLSYGTLLHLYFQLPGDNEPPVHAIGTIVRTRALLPEMPPTPYYSTLMSIRMIDSHDRSRLMGHVLNEQRKALLCLTQTSNV